jgi:hypothetical protein
MSKKKSSEEPLQRAHPELLTPFQTELRAASDPQSLTEFIRKYITTGSPVVIDSETFYTIRRRVSREFGIHPSAVVLVGSCKLGFTLKMKDFGTQRSRYAAASPSSDVDVAVVSERIFDEIWEAVFRSVYPKRDWPLDIGREFVRDLFNGWISPGDLPNKPTFQRALLWSEFFALLSRERVCGRRTINARLYRTWDRLEAYQQHLVRDCYDELLQEMT